VPPKVGRGPLRALRPLLAGTDPSGTPVQLSAWFGLDFGRLRQHIQRAWPIPASMKFPWLSLYTSNDW